MSSSEWFFRMMWGDADAIYTFKLEQHSPFRKIQRQFSSIVHDLSHLFGQASWKIFFDWIKFLPSPLKIYPTLPQKKITSKAAAINLTPSSGKVSIYIFYLFQSFSIAKKNFSEHRPTASSSTRKHSHARARGFVVYASTETISFRCGHGKQKPFSFDRGWPPFFVDEFRQAFVFDCRSITILRSFIPQTEERVDWVFWKTFVGGKRTTGKQWKFWRMKKKKNNLARGWSIRVMHFLKMLNTQKQRHSWKAKIQKAPENLNASPV